MIYHEDMFQVTWLPLEWQECVGIRSSHLTGRNLRLMTDYDRDDAMNTLKFFRESYKGDPVQVGDDEFWNLVTLGFNNGGWSPVKPDEISNCYDVSEEQQQRKADRLIKEGNKDIECIYDRVI
jgi:hypothetical protein